MSTTQDDLFSTTGPDAGISREDLEQAEELIDVLEEPDWLSREDLKQKNNEKWPGNSLFDDERGVGLMDLKYQPAPLDLPSFGEIRDDPECGTQLPYICNDCGRPIEVGRTCAQSMCPRCAPKWVIDRATPIVSKIWSAARMKDGSQKLHHVAVDIHGDNFVDADKPEQEIKKALQDFMKEIGMDGAVFYHPWRGDKTDEDGERLPWQKENDDRGEWQDRLFAGRDWEGDVREELSHEPHFHLIGCAEWFPGGDVTREIYDQTGFLFERIAGNDGRSINNDDMENLARAVTYCLSHTAIDTRGERNRYVCGKVGSAYHNADDRHDRQARQAVQSVAPETLGVPSMEIECREELPEEEVEDDHQHTTSSSTGDGDGDAGDDSPSTATPTRPCKGALSEPDDADFVEDDDWRQGARYADEADEVRRTWQAIGGWQGWVGNDVELEDVVTITENDPPP